MGQAIDRCSGCGEYGPTSDAGWCSRCIAGQYGELGIELHRLGVESFELVRGPVGEFGVLDFASDDIIGSGANESEALADAIATVREWNAKKPA